MIHLRDLNGMFEFSWMAMNLFMALWEMSRIFRLDLIDTKQDIMGYGKINGKIWELSLGTSMEKQMRPGVFFCMALVDRRLIT